MAILIHTTSIEEESLIENLLKKMKISFERKAENQKITVSKAEMESIKKGLEQANKEQFISNQEVHKKARLLCSK